MALSLKYLFFLTPKVTKISQTPTISYNITIPPRATKLFLSAPHFYLFDAAGVFGGVDFVWIGTRTRQNFHYFSIFFTRSKTNLYWAPSSWVFRELNEFFGNIFKQQYDSRNLLLDYNANQTPLQPLYSESGEFEIRYDLTTNTLKYVSLNIIEL